MKTPVRIPVTWIVGAIALLALVPLRAEITVYGDAPPVTTIISGSITDDSDPITPWQPMGPLIPGTLQGSGGAPRVFFVAGSGQPVAVWADDSNGPDSEIAYAEWSPAGWNQEILTAGAGDDLDPRVFVRPDGTVDVVWWRPAEPADKAEVWWIVRPAGASAWNAAERVSAGSESARRPSVAVLGSAVWIAYERDTNAAGMTQEVVAARSLAGGGFQREILSATPRAEALDAIAHVTAGTLWIDWKHSATSFRCAEFIAPSWSGLAEEPLTDPSWIGVESMHKILQQHVIDP